MVGDQDDRDILTMIRVLDYNLRTLDGLTANLPDMITPAEAAAAEIVKRALVRIITESVQVLDPRTREAFVRCGSRSF